MFGEAQNNQYFLLAILVTFAFAEETNYNPHVMLRQLFNKSTTVNMILGYARTMKFITTSSDFIVNIDCSLVLWLIMMRAA